MSPFSGNFITIDLGESLILELLIIYCQLVNSGQNLQIGIHSDLATPTWAGATSKVPRVLPSKYPYPTNQKHSRGTFALVQASMLWSSPVSCTVCCTSLDTCCHWVEGMQRPVLGVLQGVSCNHPATSTWVQPVDSLGAARNAPSIWGTFKH